MERSSCRQIFLHSISMHSISAGLPEAVGGGVPTWDINWAQFTSGWSKLMSHSSIQVESSPPHWESRDPQAPLSWALTLPRPHHPPRQRGQPEPVREISSDNCLHYCPNCIVYSIVSKLTSFFLSSASFSFLNRSASSSLGTGFQDPSWDKKGGEMLMMTS